MNYRYILFILLILALEKGNTFLPSKETGREKDYSHESITEKAFYKATAIYIARFVTTGVYDLDDINSLQVIQETYSDNLDALKIFARDLEEIVKANNQAQKSHGDEADRTMNCEQISKGHLLLQTIRENIISQSRQLQPNWDILRDLIGEYLFTLQSFYSNTNWVEGHGNQTCKELGISGEQLLPTAPISVATCKSCNDTMEALSVGSCKNNVLVNDNYLTSGYISFQHITKPLEQWPTGYGKCSHGGQYDDSKDIPATGGINKETSDPTRSPHFYLHKTAGEAAVEATVQFLVGNDTGLLDIVGPDVFAHILDLNYINPCYNCFSPQLSLVFVIDDTGSMMDEIYESRRQMVDIVNQAIVLGADGPKNYVLATFNDPDTHVSKTTNGQVMKTRIQAVTAHGGGDCPEMALAGLLKGINEAEPGSCLFFFTDADAKDDHLTQEVIRRAKEKDIHMAFILRGQCSKRRKRDVKNFEPVQPECLGRPKQDSGRRRKRRSSLDIFNLIAEETSGSIYHVTSSTLGATLGKLVEKNLGVKSLQIYTFTLSSGSIEIPIDKDLALFMVEIKGIYSISDVILFRPDGSTQTYSGDSSLDDIGRNTMILSVKDVLPGVYKLKCSSGSSWNVKVTGSGNIDFTYKFLEEIRGLKFQITGTNPVAGTLLTISVTATGLTNETKVTDIVLRRPNGHPLQTFPVTDLFTKAQRTFTADLTIPVQDFYVTIEGELSSKPFRRARPDVIKPASGEIEISPQHGSLIPHRMERIKVNVKNADSGSQTFQLVATDTQKFLTGSTTKTISLLANEEREVNFEIVATSPSSVTLLTVKLLLGSTIIQTEKRYLMVAKVTPPIITVNHKTDNCYESSLNYYNCSTQSWMATMTIQFEVNMTSEITSPSNVEFDYEYTSVDNKQLNATISGNCCTPKASVLIVDDAYNRAGTDFDFTGGQAFSNNVSLSQLFQSDMEVNDVGNSKNGKREISVLALVGGIVGGVALITTAIVITLLVRTSIKPSVKDYDITFPDKMCADKSSKVKFANRK